jgi:hypothetical protein
LADVSTIYPHLLHSRQNIRKRAISAISAAVHALSDSDYPSLMATLCDSLSLHQNKPEHLITFLELAMNIWYCF